MKVGLKGDLFRNLGTALECKSTAITLQSLLLLLTEASAGESRSESDGTRGKSKSDDDVRWSRDGGMMVTFAHLAIVRVTISSTTSQCYY